MSEQPRSAAEPFVEFGTGWAKVHFRRELTERDRANILAAVRTEPPGDAQSACMTNDATEPDWKAVAERAKDASDKVLRDAKVDPAQLHVPYSDAHRKYVEEHGWPLPQPAQAPAVTDAMCEAAIEADVRDRIQGFSYKARHVIRDVSLPPDQQEIWSAPVVGPDEYQAFQKQCRIERMRKVLEAALATQALPQAPALASIPAHLNFLIGRGKTRPNEPLYGVQILDGLRVLVETENDDLDAAIKEAVSLLPSQERAPGT